MDLIKLFYKADITDLNKAEKTLAELGKTSSATQGKAEGFTKVLDKLGPTGAAAGSAINMVLGPTVLLASAAVAAAGALAKLALSVADTGDAMNDMANRTNIATERLSLYDAIAKMAGSSAEELVSSAERLGTKLARQDEESGRASSALKELGISTKEANGEQKSMLQLQEDIVLAVDKATNQSKAEGAALQLLGNDYYKLRTAVREAHSSKSEMYDYMQKVGATVTTKLAKDSDNLNDSISKLKLAFTGMGQSIGSIVIPILNTVIDKIGAIAADAAALVRKYTGNSTAGEVASNRVANTQSQLDYQKGLRGSVQYKDPRRAAEIDATISRLEGELSAAQSDAILARKSMDAQKSDAINGKAGDGNRPAGRDGKSTSSSKGTGLSDADIYKMQQEDLQRHYADQALIDEANRQARLEAEKAFATQMVQVRAFQVSEAERIVQEDFENAKLLADRQTGLVENQYSSILQIGQFALNNLSQTMMNLFVGGEFSAKKFFTSVLQGISQMILQMTVLTPLMKGMEASFGSPSGGGFASLASNVMKFIPSIFGFADGGNPPVGKVSLVGERGPELFVPKTAGTIIPNHMLQGGAGTVVNNNLSVSIGSVDSDERQASLMREMKQLMEATSNAQIAKATRPGGALHRKMA
jgi:hypothetical protein